MRDTNTVMSVLQEECAEVIQAVSKINRFGFSSSWDGKTNLESLVMELGDVLALIDVLLEDTDINISREDLEVAKANKMKRLEIFLPHD